MSAPESVPQNLFSDLLNLLGHPGPSIVDAGANKGRVLARMLEVFPQARALAIEPIPELARKLRKRFRDQRVEVRELALGEHPGRACLHIPDSRTLSSLLPLQGLKEKYPERDLEVRRVLEVEVQRLDNLLAKAPDILKLDLQGFELAALKGAGELLARTKFIYCEVAFAQFYLNQPLYKDISEFLLGRGFKLAGLYDLKRDSRGKELSADALFYGPGVVNPALDAERESC